MSNNENDEIQPADSTEEPFWAELIEAISAGDDSAAKEHLAAGRWITYRDRKLANQLVREWPNGLREIITADEQGNITVLKTL